MTKTITDLQRHMDDAAQSMDFEEARRLRDQINIMRGGGAREEAEQVDTSGLTRQQPGAMGIGTNRQRVTPSPGWKPPPKPDPMVRGTNRRGKAR